MRSTRSFTLAHLRSQVLALLLVCIQVLGQSFALRGWKAHLPLVAFCRSPWILTLIILTVPHIPIIEKHLVKERFLLVLCQQRAFERVIKVLFIGDIDIFQCLGKIKHLARPYIDTYLPEDAAKFSPGFQQHRALYTDRHCATRAQSNTPAWPVFRVRLACEPARSSILFPMWENRSSSRDNACVKHHESRVYGLK